MTTTDKIVVGIAATGAVFVIATVIYGVMKMVG